PATRTASACRGRAAGRSPGPTASIRRSATTSSPLFTPEGESASLGLHAGDAAGLVFARRGHRVLEPAARLLALPAGVHVRPRFAPRVLVAGDAAEVGVGLVEIEVAEVVAEAVHVLLELAVEAGRGGRRGRAHRHAAEAKGREGEQRALHRGSRIARPKPACPE